MKAVFWGLLIPFIGTAAGAACVFFLQQDLKAGVAAGPDRLCGRRYGGRLHLEPDRSGNRAVLR